MNETPEQHRKNLGKLRLGLKVCYWIVLAIAFGLPLLTEGTEHHESAQLVRNFIGLGMILSAGYFQWFKLVARYHLRSGHDIDGPRILPAMLVGALPGTLVTYFAYKALTHWGDWNQLLVFSWGDVLVALIFNVVLALGFVSILLVRVRYHRKTDVVTGHGQSSSFRKTAFWFFFVPVLFLAVFIALWIMKTAAALL